MTMNFNDAGPQQNFEVIPEGTVAVLRLTVRPWRRRTGRAVEALQGWKLRGA